MANNVNSIDAEGLDFLHEMLNIWVGNAGTALSQLLKIPVTVSIPSILYLRPTQVVGSLSDPTEVMYCMRMRFFGEVEGQAIFLVNPDISSFISQQAEKNAKLVPGQLSPEVVITEIANILTGVYMTALHDFCHLNILHSVPEVAKDMIQAILEENLCQYNLELPEVLMVVNEFQAENIKIKAILLFFFASQTMQILLGKIHEARRMYGAE